MATPTTGIKVGALAAATGLTVRTLHYWESIGILRASRRGLSGHREYTDDDLVRLYQIVALRSIGLDLATITTCLDATVDPRRVLADHLTSVDAAISSMTALRDRLQTIDAQVAAGHLPEPATLVDAIRASRDANPDRQAALGEHLDSAQLAKLETVGATLGSVARYYVEVEWPQLYRRAETLRRAGTAPSDAKIRAIVQRMDRLSKMFTNSDARASAGVRAAWRENPAAMSGEPHAPAEAWRALVDYIDAVRDAMGQPATPIVEPVR